MTRLRKKYCLYNVKQNLLLQRKMKNQGNLLVRRLSVILWGRVTNLRLYWKKEVWKFLFWVFIHAKLLRYWSMSEWCKWTMFWSQCCYWKRCYFQFIRWLFWFGSWIGQGPQIFTTQIQWNLKWWQFINFTLHIAYMHVIFYIMVTSFFFLIYSLSHIK